MVHERSSDTQLPKRPLGLLCGREASVAKSRAELFRDDSWNLRKCLVGAHLPSSPFSTGATGGGACGAGI